MPPVLRATTLLCWHTLNWVMLLLPLLVLLLVQMHPPSLHWHRRLHQPSLKQLSWAQGWLLLLTGQWVLHLATQISELGGLLPCNTHCSVSCAPDKSCCSLFDILPQPQELLTHCKPAYCVGPQVERPGRQATWCL